VCKEKEMEEISINLIQLLKLNLTVNEYLTLLKLKLIGEDISFPFSSTESCISSLIEKGYMIVDGDLLKFSHKGEKVFKEAGVRISEKDFEELYNLYPSKTAGGRRLRSSARLNSGSPTRDFSTCYRKYCNIVKDLSMHEDIVSATKNMLYDYKRRGSMEFLQNIETYIHQRTWEKYLDLSPLDIYSGENVERL
jgi:hypothetical protein